MLRIILLFRDIFLAEWDFWVLIHQIINLFLGCWGWNPGGAFSNLSLFYQSNKAHGLSSPTRTGWSGTTVPLSSLGKFFEALWCVIWEEQESLLFLFQGIAAQYFPDIPNSTSETSKCVLQPCLLPILLGLSSSEVLSFELLRLHHSLQLVQPSESLAFQHYFLPGIWKTSYLTLP